MKRAAIGPILFVLTAAVACANSASLGTPSDIDDAGVGAPLVHLAQDASSGDVSTPLLCLETSCVAPYATCPNSTWTCDTNLDTDPKNCGECGAVCPPGSPPAELGMTFACIDGRCAGKCATIVDFVSVRRYADCNGGVDDGCEIQLGGQQNCGNCGDDCPPGLECLNFQCGCRPPFVRSGDECVCPPGTTECRTASGKRYCADTTQADHDCNACGNACNVHDAAEPNAYYGCLTSTCEQWKCEPGWLNCDQAKDTGCEVDPNWDPNNCGECGHACAPGKECYYGQCICEFGTRCGEGWCADLDNDPLNCGTCGKACPGLTANEAGWVSGTPPPHGAPSCIGARCDYTCDPGWADCDEDVTNGCESNILTNPVNCGSCTIQCDIADGQVCSRGQCAMRECTSEVQ